MTLIFYIAFLALGISGSVLGAGVTYLSELFDVPIEQSGVFISLHTVGTFFATLVVGRLLDQFNTRRVVWIGAGVLAVGNGIMFLAISSAAAFVGMTLIGLGFGGILVGGNVVAARLNPLNPARAVNLISVFFGIGGMIGPQVATIAINQGRITFAHLFIAITMLILIPFLLKIRLEPPVKRIREAGQPRLKLSTDALVTFALFAVFLCIYTGAEIGFSSWIFTQMRAVADVPEAAAASVVSLFWAGITVGRLVGSFIVQRITSEALMVGASAAVALSVALLLFLPPSGLIGAICTFLFGFCAGPIFPVAITLAQQRFPQSGGTIAGILMALGNLGVIFIPWLQGQVGRGESGGMEVTLVATLIITGLAFLLARRGRVHAPS